MARPLRPLSIRHLQHLPGTDGLPLVGHLPWFLHDARNNQRLAHARFGRCYRAKFFTAGTALLLGEEALELVLRDRDRVFSSELGWGFSLRKLFPRGLMLRDFDDHRHHRRILQVAFRRRALEGYLDRMGETVARRLPQWGRDPEILLYPRIKQLTLDVAARIFLGLSLGPRADRLNEAFVATVAASLGIWRVPMPGSAMARGVAARRELAQFLRSLIPSRRRDEGTDMLSELCRARDDDGRMLDDGEIVDHMIFLLMAAHDTVTSALTTTAYYLAAHPRWQSRLREASEALGTDRPGHDELAGLVLHQHAFQEALRLHTPVPYIPRRALRPVCFDRWRLPANTHLSVVPDFTHHDPLLWTEPERFDPARFGPGRAEHERHRFAFAPFGGGAHICLGAQFAHLLAKVVLHQLLLRYELSLPPGYVLRMQHVPIPKPKDGLPMRLRRRS